MNGNLPNVRQPQISGRVADDPDSDLALRVATLSSNAYWLRENVYACGTREGAVFLDLERNKYFAIGPQETSALSAVVEGWHIECEPSQSPKVASENLIPSTVAKELETAGLLSRKPPVGSLGTLSINLNTTLSSVGEEFTAESRIGARHILCFVRSCIYAAWSLRFRRLTKVVHAVHKRKSQHSPARAAADLERLAELVDVFRTMRPYVFRAEARCLFHALALVKFLSYHDMYVTWVLGVKVMPWAAHSWAQVENLILDTNPERVSEYTPIFAV